MDPRSIAVTVECFVKKGGKYSMLQRAKHKKIMSDIWMAPGGHIEFNEGLFEDIFGDTKGAMQAIGDYHIKDRGVQRMLTSYSSQGLYTS